MKKTIIVTIAILLFITCGACAFILFNIDKKNDKYELNGTEISAILPQVNDQKEINKKLNEITNDKKYTFDNAYVELNPYKISPLSAIIIFQTKDNKEVEVYINGKKTTTMESTKKHVIPVYGLYEDYENVVKLVIDSEEKEYKIKTEKSNMEYPLEVEYVADTINKEDIYFTVASYKTYLTGWDVEGKLRFYLTVDNRMDVEWLDNGHFLLGTSQGQFAENFCAFVEMDYLGKIYNYYVPENGYSFEFQVLKSGNYMLAGGSTPVFIKEQVVYEIDPKTGNKLTEINLSKIVKEIDPDFSDVYLGQKAIRNAFYYNEDTNELLMSFRGWDAVVSFDYSKKKLNWVFTDPSNELFAKDVWKDYLVTLESGRYPLGEHSVILTSEGNVGFFNNGYNRLHGFENGGNNEVSYYTNNYSSGEVYKIENKVAKLVFNYDGDKKYFSHQYGSFKEMENGNYLIDFGYTLHDDYKKSSTGKLSEAEESPKDIYAKIVEVDKNGNVMFSAKSEEGKFRAFKHNLYNEKTNIDVNELEIHNKVKRSEIEIKEIDTDKLKENEDWIYSLTFTQNSFVTNYEILEKDEIKLYFVGKDGMANVFTYKESDTAQLKKIFNVDLKGKYELFIELNGKLYKTNTIYKF